MSEGYVYVLEFSSGRLKVGFTTNIKARLASHATTAKAYGASITRTWNSPYHEEAGANEKLILAKCRSTVGVEAEGEYFAGASWDDVVAYAEAELSITEVAPGQSAGDRRRAHAREERARILDAFEDRTEFIRRRVGARLRDAGVPVERFSGQMWLLNSKVARVAARLQDGESVDDEEIRAAFGLEGDV
jgi:hypothetical protein